MTDALAAAHRLLKIEATVLPAPPAGILQDAFIVARALPDLLAALRATTGYLLNAKIDLETGAPKKTALATIEGGITMAKAALVEVERERRTTNER